MYILPFCYDKNKKIIKNRLLKEVYHLNWKSFFIGLGSGLIGGLAASYLVSKEYPIKVSPEKVLEQVKTQFKEQGPISGSWINMEAVPYENNHLKYKVYKGGISQNKEDHAIQYEFIADALTGTIISVEQL